MPCTSRTALALLLLAAPRLLAVEVTYDLVVYGGNAAGVAAAVQAARMGATVVLLEPGSALGGLTTGGLGATDVGDKRMVGGLAREFYRRVHDHYAQPGAWRRESRAEYLPRHPLNVTEAAQQHWFFEPHVASRILDDLIREARVLVHLNARLDRARGVAQTNGRITAITLLDGRTLHGRTFIDATYEGDLMAAAGVGFARGREPNRQYGETLNGIRFPGEKRTMAIDPFVRAGDPASGLLPRIAPRAPGAEGDGDPGVQAYNFRVCLTDVPENRVPFARPSRYDPLQYELLLRSLGGRPVLPGPQLFTLTPMPNRKTDTNNRELFSTDYVGRSHGWVEASYAEREQLWQEHKDYTQGLFWFLAHDPRVPEATRRAVGRWGLARDEFVATGHWPFQLYVREARRLRGEYVITEHDARRKTKVPDPVAFASYALDSHAVGLFVDPAGRLRIEGSFFENIRAFPLSYRALLPRRTECANLLVPVCLSASHAAYGSVRMEPVFIMLGQAAATAAILAQSTGASLHDLPYATLRTRLLRDGAVLAVPQAEPSTGSPTGPTPDAAVAAVAKLQHLGFFAPAEASVSAWRNATRPGASSEAARTVALIVATAQRFDRQCTSLDSALSLLARRGVAIDAAYWTARQPPDALARGEAVSAVLIQLAGAFERAQTSATVPTATPAEVHRHFAASASETYPISIPRPIRNRWITLANEGTDIVVHPRLVANGRHDWFRTADILAGIIEPEMTDRAKALAIWRFLVDHRYHDAPAHGGIELHDPVRFLNVYGYGFCDDSAVNFMVLAQQAGLRARVWGLSGHVVPEAFFENGWRLLDPDGQIFYLEDDGHTIAGVETLARRPDLFHKYPSPYYRDSAKLAALYTSTADNKVNDVGPRQAEAVHTMAFNLRPGESLTRHHGNWGLYFAGEKSPRPPKSTPTESYGNGRFVFSPVFTDGLFARGADEVSGLSAVRDGPGWMLASADREGSLVYRFTGPYPYLDGSVTVTGRGRFTLAFSENGEVWAEVWASHTDPAVDTTVPLTGQFRTREGRPMYSYRLKLTVNGRVQALRFQSDIQIAPASLPTLDPGENAINYRDATGKPGRVRIEFAYDPVAPK